MKYVITGASDDTIEIDGDERDEFSGGNEPRYLLFDDGTVLSAAYCPGEYKGWEIVVYKPGKLATATREPLDNDADDPDPYSDTVTVEGATVFIGCFNTPEGPDEDELDEWAHEEFYEMPIEKKRAAYNAAHAA